MLLIDDIKRYGLTYDAAAPEEVYNRCVPVLRETRDPVFEISNVAEAWIMMKTGLKGRDPIDWNEVTLCTETPLNGFFEVSNTKPLNRYLPVKTPLLQGMPTSFGAICETTDMWKSALMEDPGVANIPDFEPGEYIRSLMCRVLDSPGWQNRIVGNHENAYPDTPVRWSMELYLIAAFRTMGVKKPVGPLSQMTVLIQPNGRPAMNKAGAPVMFISRHDYLSRDDTAPESYLEVARDTRARTWFEPVVFAQALMHMSNMLIWDVEANDDDKKIFRKKYGLDPMPWRSLGVSGYEPFTIPFGTAQRIDGSALWVPATDTV